jgi:hypothetical protein
VAVVQVMMYAVHAGGSGTAIKVSLAVIGGSDKSITAGGGGGAGAVGRRFISGGISPAAMAAQV